MPSVPPPRRPRHSPSLHVPTPGGGSSRFKPPSSVLLESHRLRAERSLVHVALTRMRALWRVGRPDMSPRSRTRACQFSACSALILRSRTNYPFMARSLDFLRTVNLHRVMLARALSHARGAMGRYLSICSLCGRHLIALSPRTRAVTRDALCTSSRH